MKKERKKIEKMNGERKEQKMRERENREKKGKMRLPLQNIYRFEGF